MINRTDTQYTSVINGLEKAVTNILLNTDGSTTRLLENLTGGEVTVNVHMQGFFSKESLPPELTGYFKSGGSFLYRIVSLYCNGEPLSDNVVMAPENALNIKLRQDIENGKVPLGKLIDSTEHRRKLISAKVTHSSKVQDMFCSFILKDDFFPVKKYTIIKDDENWFYICEVFHYKNICKYFKKMVVE